MDEVVVIISCASAAGGAAGVFMSFLTIFMCGKIGAWIENRKNGVRISVNHKYNEPKKEKVAP